MMAGPLAFARRLGAKLAGRAGDQPDMATPDIDPWAVRGERAPALPVLILLDEIETAALAVYETHGLPTRKGQYARSARGRTWKFVAETLTAEERWALFLANDNGKGWRFASLEDLGALERGSPDLRKAAELMTACRVLRLSLAGQGETSRAEDIETAVRLGSEWRLIELGLARSRDGALRLGKPKRSARSRRGS